MMHTSWKHQLLADDGSVNIMTMALIITLFVGLLPLVWNLGAVYSMDGQSQAASDAAALAAASVVAQQLNDASGHWWHCGTDALPPEIIREYVHAVVQPIAGGQGGVRTAEAYATRNNATLDAYEQRLASGAQQLQGVTIPSIHLDVHVEAPLRGLLPMRQASTWDTNMSAHTTAEVYLADVEAWQTPCVAGPSGEQVTAKQYTFRWNTRLVRTGG